MADSTLIQNLDTILNAKNDIKDKMQKKFGVNLSSTPFKDYGSIINGLEVAPFTPKGTPVQPSTFGQTSGTLSSNDTTPMYYNGNFYAYKVMNAVWNDYAEFFEADGEWEYGDIIELNPETKKYSRP